MGGCFLSTFRISNAGVCKCNNTCIKPCFHYWGCCKRYSCWYYMILINNTYALALWMLICLYLSLYIPFTLTSIVCLGINFVTFPNNASHPSSSSNITCLLSRYGYMSIVVDLVWYMYVLVCSVINEVFHFVKHCISSITINYHHLSYILVWIPKHSCWLGVIKPVNIGHR